MPSPVVFTIKGLDDIQRGFKALRQPELSRTAKPAYAEASRKVMVPEVKKQAPVGAPPHRSAKRGKRGRRGPLNKTVTSRLVKRSHMPSAIRSLVLFAYSTAPRAWYRHFVVKGTQRHSLAKGSRLRGGIGQNLPPIHPGARGNDFVGRAQDRGEAPFVRYISEALIRSYKQRARSK